MQSKKIVLLEDDQSIAEIVIFLLTRKQHQVLHVLADDYLQQIAEFQPHLILLDVWLQGHGDGEIICQEIKQRFSFKVVLFSAVTGLEKISVRCEADGYIEKPFEVEEFEKKVDYYLGN